MKHMLSEPDRLRFTGKAGEVFIGGSQAWYESRWQRESGCGPVAASNLIWYLTRADGGMDEYIQLMHDVYPCYSPKLRGVSSAALFIKGLDRYGEKHGPPTAVGFINIPARKSKRPSVSEVRDFIALSLSDDAPVALLSLSSGKCDTVEHWHWVTIVSFEEKSAQAEISDYGRLKYIDINLWLETSRLGGALVRMNL